jgi:hypothetical protein
LASQSPLSAVWIRNLAGSRPVMNPARDGEHTGDAVWKSVKMTPVAARRSRWGVWGGAPPDGPPLKVLSPQPHCRSRTKVGEEMRVHECDDTCTEEQAGDESSCSPPMGRGAARSSGAMCVSTHEWQLCRRMVEVAYSSMIVRLLGARGQHQWTNDAHVTHVIGQKKDEVWPSRSALWRSPSRRADASANSQLQRTELQRNQCPEGTERSMRLPERRSPYHGRSLVLARCASSCCTRRHHCFGVAEPRHTAAHPRHRARAVHGGVCSSFEVAHNCTF